MYLLDINVMVILLLVKGLSLKIKIIWASSVNYFQSVDFGLKKINQIDFFEVLSI